MSESEDNAPLRAVQQRMIEACERSHRSINDVTLVAVSKKKTAEHILSLYKQGQRHFGENYAQELEEKALLLKEKCPDIVWHSIGTLQSNKAKIPAQHAKYFHALDRVSIGVELNKKRETLGQKDPLRCFIEVNLGDESTKGGVQAEVESIQRLQNEVNALPHLQVIGLMALPPPLFPAEQMRASFSRLRSLSLELGLPHLSMGTTDDFEIAIEEGATFIRVGRALFGERQT